MLYGFLILLLGCLCQGSFGLGMKKYQPFSWEAFWTLFSVVGILIIPIAWTWLEAPQFLTYIMETKLEVLVLASFCGFLWGISAILFGKAVDSIGVSLTYGINMGISASLGSLIPLILFGEIPVASSFITLLLGMVVMLGGVGIITKAGLDKEKLINQDDDLLRQQERDQLDQAKIQMKEQVQVNSEGNAMRKGLSQGILMASLAGLGSAAMNIGFSYANQTLAIATSHGVNAVNASLIPWVITLSGGFVANFAYSFMKLIKNRSYRDYVAVGAGKAYGKALATSLIWFLALGFYAKASVMLGPLGASVGWLTFNGLALIVSNVWGLLDGEWKGYDKPKRLLLIGNAFLIISWIIVGIANSLA
ncbi:L-rhamnose-H+ transport protein [Paenibacillus turicensis]|uniref:L-rhamnose-H+ transport protein n=1 Tax=Paenibacillus turicensis TaxID=160487 RepID=A0ABS4FTG2_9BACL|nr:L-rhamnose/proton symporter RhaT [Paenibacillus turicensis]MBP1905869.1 L-rhamnose-H+ transport protein [Paenibacillus turicensis]